MESTADRQKGLPAILKQAKGKSADIDAIIGRAQWFYFGKKRGVSVPFEVYRRYRKGELESRPMGTSKKFGSLMSGGQGDSSASSVPAPGAGQGPSGAGAIGAAAGGAAPAPAAPAAAQPGRKGSVSVHGEGISVLSAEDDAAVTRAAVVVESSGVRAPAPSGASTSEPSNDMPFDEVVRLIQEGRANEVPRKEVPEGLNVEPASESKLAPRRKPWETASAGASGAASSSAAAPAQAQASSQDAQGEHAQPQQ